MRRWLPLGALLLLLGGAGLAFARWPRPSTELSVRGVVLEVQASGLVYPEWFRLRDSTGREWRFGVDPAAVTDRTHPMNAAHLRQHLALADPVTVFYREEPTGPVAYRIED
ncbi:MAG: hypothetical protein KatS3mg061_0133 [Dehalococcoidia bacterium]|nr:MAG: hypothetical protein KatS3mg061_0133 [Dehalococcoidia bacterium]